MEQIHTHTIQKFDNNLLIQYIQI